MDAVLDPPAFPTSSACMQRDIFFADKYADAMHMLAVATCAKSIDAIMADAAERDSFARWQANRGRQGT